MLTQADKQFLAAKGISPEEAEAQLVRFRTGFPYLKIMGTATVGDGIVRLSTDEENKAVERWHNYLAEGNSACKFVPASGAASRMFKAMFAFVDGADDTAAPGTDAREVIDNIHKFAFFDELNATTLSLYNATVDTLIATGRHKDVIAAIIGPQGLNYGNLPKGLLLFHSYDGAAPRTPIEEQIAEGAATAAAPGGTLKLHFTVSPAHRELFRKKLDNVIGAAEKKYNVSIDVSMSEQKAATDTIAANPDGTPFRQEDGSLLFRPGGHGALIENLNEIDAPVVFIKNIDNVVPDRHREATVRYKQVLAGYLIEVHDRVADYISRLDRNDYTTETLREMIAFLHNVLNVRDPKMKVWEDNDLVNFLRDKFNRPLRVCGMVRNEGEPGGGPYIAVNPDGTSSPQILESHQIDPSNADYKKMMAKATHFNPVDLVCYLQDIDGHRYDLRRYVDPATGFISSKSAHGRELKALELPGLWNGAMSDWNTIFIEVPIATFNPVKTINDLLRPAHQ